MAKSPIHPTEAVSIRRFPYPYRAMLAICSDLDETPNREIYFDTLRFLNSTAATAWGRGLGLEVGNTIYFDMPLSQFSYWNTDDAGRAAVQSLIRSGHIDCLHSYGDLAANRDHAARAIDELVRRDCRLAVWIDHGTAPSNFGGDIMRGRGDIPGSDVYHADLTCSYGIRYVWRGRVTSVVGQNIPSNLRGIWTAKHPYASAKTLAKESVKGLIARTGNQKYAMHSANEVLRPIRLRSGHPVHEFIRSNPHWGGISCGDRADRFSEVLTESMLSRLIRREGVSILYTHLGKFSGSAGPFGPEARRTLELLARHFVDGNILVASTRRTLDYCSALQNIRLSLETKGNILQIEVHTEQPVSSLQGLSVYVPEYIHTTLMLNGKEVAGLKRNPPDHTGRHSISLPWTRLEFPDH